MLQLLCVCMTCPHLNLLSMPSYEYILSEPPPCRAPRPFLEGCISPNQSQIHVLSPGGTQREKLTFYFTHFTFLLLMSVFPACRFSWGFLRCPTPPRQEKNSSKINIWNPSVMFYKPALIHLSVIMSTLEAPVLSSRNCFAVFLGFIELGKALLGLLGLSIHQDYNRDSCCASEL